MSDIGQDKVIAFDTLFTTNQIQMLKILMSYFDRPMQKNMAIYIKYMELQYTMTFFQKYPTAGIPGLHKESGFDIMKLCSEAMPFCGSEEKAKMENMQNMFQTFENYKGMMEMVQMMKELFPEGQNPMDSDFLSGMAGMSGMGGMGGMGGFDPSQIFEMFQTMSGSGGEENGTAETTSMDG